MKIQELRNLIKTEVRKVVNERKQIKKAINENYRTPDQNLDELIKLLKSNKTKSALELVLSVKSNLEDDDFETAFDEAVEMWLDDNS
jgi:uncharacterized tellurite resistance protein B-like protein